MDEFMTFREWLKERFKLTLETRWTIKILATIIGGIFLIAFSLGYVPIKVFGVYGLLITIPALPPVLLYWIYRLERLFTIDLDKMILKQIDGGSQG